MHSTISLNKNHEFRRVYSSGKSSASSLLAVYCKKNRSPGQNRLGLTVGTKVGNAVTRNRIKRKIREIYRLHESDIAKGYDIVVVARVKSKYSDYHALEADVLKLFKKLNLMN